MKQSGQIENLRRAFEQRESELKLDNEQLIMLNEALREAERKSAILSSIVESSDDAIISKDLNGTVTSWNTAAHRIFGYTQEEMIGQPILKLIPENLRYEETEILAKLRRGIRIDRFETIRKRKDGRHIDVSLTISPIFGAAGEIIGVSKIARDMTQQRASEVNEKRLSAIITSSDDAIISKDLNSIVTSWNNSAVRIFGYSAEEMVGNSILKIIPPDRWDEEPQILSQLKSGKRVDHFETVRMKKDGTLIHVSLTISPIKDRNGKVIGLSKIARDITDKKLIEQKKNEFIGFVSHELKTPLTSLRSYIQVALVKVRAAKMDFIDHALTRAELQTKRMENMISNFLNISRFDDGKINLDFATSDVVLLLNNCIEDAKIISTKHEIAYAGLRECWIEGDIDKLLLVLTNLIGNAQKYSPAGGKIEIFCKRRGERVIIGVKDFGIGIAQEAQGGLFQKFYRVKSEETRFISGFGIGLHLSATIIAMHGSKIEVISEPQKGSTFSFELPFQHAVD